MNRQLSFAAAADWGTIAWAAETIGVSQRTVRRLIDAGTITGQNARKGSRETGRRHTIVSVDEVLRYRDAKRIVDGAVTE